MVAPHPLTSGCCSLPASHAIHAPAALAKYKRLGRAVRSVVDDVADDLRRGEGGR
jgi:hypothetical protein